VVNLQLKLQGTPVTSANPTVTPSLGAELALAPPPPVVLPAWMGDPPLSSASAR
jgi:hypothetical protein